MDLSHSAKYIKHIHTMWAVYLRFQAFYHTFAVYLPASGLLKIHTHAIVQADHYVSAMPCPTPTMIISHQLMRSGICRWILVESCRTCNSWVVFNGGEEAADSLRQSKSHNHTGTGDSPVPVWYTLFIKEFIKESLLQSPFEWLLHYQTCKKAES